MSVWIRAALAAGVSFAAATGALLGAYQVVGGGDQARQNGEREAQAGAAPADPEPAGDAAAGDVEGQAQDTAPVEALSRYDVFAPPRENDPADPINAVCGLSKSLMGGGQTMRGMSILIADEASDDEDGTLRNYSISTQGAHAFEEDGDLVVQARYASDGFGGRFWYLDAEGSPGLSDPLWPRGRITVSCDDPAAAADLLNARFERTSETRPDPVRSGAWALTFDHKRFRFSDPNIDAFVSACSPDPVLAEIPAGQRVMLSAAFDDDAVFGEEMIRSNSSERIAGNLQPMIFITVAELDEATNTATVERLRVPVDWHPFNPFSSSSETLHVRYQWEAAEVFQWTIAPDGSRSPRMRQGTLARVSIPCADPQAAGDALQAFDDNFWGR